MTSQEFNAKVSIDVDASDLPALQKLLAGTVEDLDRTSKEAQAASKALRDLAAAEKQVTSQGNLSFIKQQEKAYASYAPNIAVATRASRELATASQETEGSLISERYALYDVATTLGTASAAMLAFVAATEAAGIAFERSFADVARTTELTGEPLQRMYDDLVEISTTMPIAFGDVTKIATLGAQLNIADENLDSFTKTVAQFAATTDVTVDAAAMGFGRLAQLTKTPQSEIENLGSAIYEVGVTSVATESQILSVAQEIATVGNLAGLTGDQVIGLSGALASLGVQPELARGALLRVFGQIREAVGAGGDELARFAEAANLSSAEFVDAWENRPQEAITRLLSSLGTAGSHIDTVLQQLGVVNTRDRQVFAVLANNADFVAQSLATSADAYLENTALAEGYGIVAETVASKLQVLGQTIAAIAASASELGFLGDFVGLLQDWADLIQRIVNNPVGQVFSVIALAVAGATGALLAYVSAQALAMASAYALKTAQDGLRGTTAGLTSGVSMLTKEVLSLAVGTDRATAATARFNAAQAAGSGRLRSLGAAAKTAASGVGSVAGALRGIGGGVVGVAAFALIPAIFDQIGKSAEYAGGNVEKFVGDTSGLLDAMRQDAQSTTTVYRTISQEVTNSSRVLPPWAQSLKTAAQSQDQLKQSTEDATTAMRTQTLVMGDETKRQLAQTIASNEEFRRVYQDNFDELTKAGFDLDRLLTEILSSTTGDGGANYLKGLSEGVEATRKATIQATDATDLYSTAIGDAENAANAQQSAISALTGGVKSFDTVVSDSAISSSILESALEAVGLNADAAGAEFTEATDDLYGFVNAQVSGINAALGYQNALYGLGQSLAANGNDFSMYSVAGRENMGALQAAISAAVQSAGDDGSALATNLAQIMAALSSYGVDTVNELAWVQNMIAQVASTAGVEIPKVGNAFNRTSATIQHGYNVGMYEAAEATRQTAKEAENLQERVYTLSDYVDDLGRVLKDAFEFRHGLRRARQELDDFIRDLDEDNQLSIEVPVEIEPILPERVSISDVMDDVFRNIDLNDSVRSIYYDMVDAAKEAKQEIRDANQRIREAFADLKGLRADKSILEYQLRVAKLYGDELRAQQIQAELAQNASDRADAQRDLADAQDDARRAQQAQNKTLVGNSRAALENRNTVRGLLGNYTDYIQSLIDSGASQETINKAIREAQRDFLDQGAAMGYSRQELQQFTAIFEQYRKAQEEANKRAREERREAAERRRREREENQQRHEERRNEITDLEDLYTHYEDYILQLINSGASQEEVAEAIRKAREEFRLIGQRMGLTSPQIKRVEKSFDDLVEIIRKVPKNITVNVSDPARRALAEFNATLKNVNDRINTINGKTVSPKANPDALDSSAKKYAAYIALLEAGRKYQDALNPYNPALASQRASELARARAYYESLNTGGLVGSGRGAPSGFPGQASGSDTVATWLTPGEYVVQKSAVQAYGLPFMNALNNMQVPRTINTASASSGNASNSGPLLVELTPLQLHQLARIVSTTVVLDGSKVSNMVNQNNIRANVLGSN